MILLFTYMNSLWRALFAFWAVQKVRMLSLVARITYRHRIELTEVSWVVAIVDTVIVI